MEHSVCACVCLRARARVCVGCVCLSCCKSTFHALINQSLFQYSPKAMTIYSVSSRQIAGSQYAGRPSRICITVEERLTQPESP